jgi:hypothetical protein
MSLGAGLLAGGVNEAPLHRGDRLTIRLELDLARAVRSKLLPFYDEVGEDLPDRVYRSVLVLDRSHRPTEVCAFEYAVPLTKWPGFRPVWTVMEG